MKIRLRGNSLRLRLTQTEVQRLASGVTVEETTHFGTLQRLICRLGPTRHADAIHAGFEEGIINVEVPLNAVGEWALSDAASLCAEQEIGRDQFLTILVEKDFACLHQRGAEDEDTFDRMAGGLPHAKD